MSEPPAAGESPRPSARLSRGKRLLFAAIPLLVVVGVWELGCRLFPLSDGDRPLHYVQPHPDPELIWQLTPLEGGPQATNELGFRDLKYRPDADLKLLLLGDSIAYGDGERETWRCFPQLLELMLDQSAKRRGAPRTHEVINASVVGYSTSQQVRLLETQGLPLQPRAVLLQFCLNDVFEPYLRLASLGGDAHMLGIDTRAAIGGLHGWLVRTSRGYERLVRWRQRRARRRLAYTAENLARDVLSPEMEEAWQRTFAALERLRARCAEAKLPLLIVIAPYRFQLAAPDALRQPQDRLQRWAQERAIPTVDLLPAFAAAGRRRELFYDANHFNTAGHLVAARTLLAQVEPFLKQNGLWK